jgi:hypothetical protein
MAFSPIGGLTGRYAILDHRELRGTPCARGKQDSAAGKDERAVAGSALFWAA